MKSEWRCLGGTVYRRDNDENIAGYEIMVVGCTACFDGRPCDRKHIRAGTDAEEQYATDITEARRLLKNYRDQ